MIKSVNDNNTFIKTIFILHYILLFFIILYSFSFYNIRYRNHENIHYKEVQNFEQN